MATVEMIVRTPGLIADDMAFVAKHGGFTAIVLNKFTIVTDGPVAEWIDKDYIVANDHFALKGLNVDEVIDLSDAGLVSERSSVRAFQMAAQLALVAGEPGPRAVTYLEKVVADDKFADSQISKGKEAKAVEADAA